MYPDKPLKKALWCFIVLCQVLFVHSQHAFAINGQDTPLLNGTVKAVSDPDAAPSLDYEITPKFSLGARIDLEATRKSNRDLNSRREDDRTDIRPEFTLALQYLPRPGLRLFTQMEYSERFRIRDRENSTQRKTNTEIEKLMLHLKPFIIPPLTLKIGRQRFVDRHEWFFDETLDGIQLVYTLRPFRIQAWWNTILINPDKPEDKIQNTVLSIRYRAHKKQEVHFFGIARNDPDHTKPQTYFTGLFFKIKNKPFKYWGMAALLKEKESGDKRDGVGFDFGASFHKKSPLKPVFTLGFAYASRQFHQTGLQDNQGKWGGIAKFKYYGEVFDPELSNLWILTGGAGIRPTRNSSIDLILHHYQQVKAERRIRDDGIRRSPRGENTDLGNEADLVAALRINKHVQLEWTSGFFFPGSAFSRSGTAFLLNLEVRFIL